MGSGYTGNRGLILDVEHDQGQLYGLLQGYWNLDPTPENEGFPAAPNTGEIVVVQPDGTFRTVVRGLDRPTSLELVDGVGYVVTFSGKICGSTADRRAPPGADPPPAERPVVAGVRGSRWGHEHPHHP